MRNWGFSYNWYWQKLKLICVQCCQFQVMRWWGLFVGIIVVVCYVLKQTTEDRETEIVLEKCKRSRTKGDDLQVSAKGSESSLEDAAGQSIFSPFIIQLLFECSTSSSFCYGEGKHVSEYVCVDVEERGNILQTLKMLIESYERSTEGREDESYLKEAEIGVESSIDANEPVQTRIVENHEEALNREDPVLEPLNGNSEISSISEVSMPHTYANLKPEESKPIELTEFEVTTERSSDSKKTPHKSKCRMKFVETHVGMEVVRLTAKKFGIAESSKNWDVCWSQDFVSSSTCRHMKRNQRINHFPGSVYLSHKDSLAKNLKRMLKCFPVDYRIFPDTWILPEELSKVEKYAQNKHNSYFIAKPHNGGSGSGIFLTRDVRKLKSNKKMVCQLYIRPFLIDGYKFDLRIYVLLTSCNPLRIFVHNEGLARFATVKYEEPNEGNSLNKFMHLTNSDVNKHSSSYVVDESTGSLRSLTKLFEWFGNNKIDSSKIQESIDDVVVKTIISALPTLRYFSRSSLFKKRTNSYFELMGFDIMLDTNLKAYLIEVNVCPYLSVTATWDTKVKEEVLFDTFRILNLSGSNDQTNENVKRSKPKMSRGQANRKVDDESETQSRIKWENSHLGNFRKVYPSGPIRMKYYRKLIKALFSADKDS